MAELYGYVNRSFPDADLDAFVDALATRIASFDKRAISETKRFADVASLPPDFEIAPEWDVCIASIMRPAAQERIKKLLDQGFQSFTQGGVQKFILITETVPAHYDCHGCAPIIGGALFSQQGNSWQLDSENKFVSIMGSWGSAPKGKLLKIGPDQYGVIFHAGGTGQGITEEAVVIIGQVQDTVRELLMILDYGGDNAGACGDESLPACWKFSSKMDFEPGANPDYFDIKVTTTGTKEDDNGNIRRANSVKKYTFTNGKYVPAK